MSDTREAEGPHYPLANLPSSTSPESSDLESPGSKEEIKDDKQVLTAEQNGENAPSESQYITGFALWVNMISLMLSIFLIALDMVCFFSVTPLFSYLLQQFLFATLAFVTMRSLLIKVLDHRRDLCTRHHKRLPRHQRPGLVRLCFLSYRWWLPINLGQNIPEFPSQVQLSHCHFHLRSG
jgi:hypothetical protein